MGFLPIASDVSMRRHVPFVTYLIIAANGAMWAYQLTQGESFTDGYAAVPYKITHDVDLSGVHTLDTPHGEVDIPEYPGPHPIALTLLTAMFMHGSWMHIAGNMLYLWIFAGLIEDLLGHGRFLLFYLLCGLAAAAAQIMGDPDSIVPTLGASGAIAGVLGAYLVKYPMNDVQVILGRTLTVMPAWIVLGFWFALQVFEQIESRRGQDEGGVAYLAHIGGFTAGVVLVFLMAGLRRRPRADDG
jgi:membrane associated rhomboid family serine protease